MSGRRETNRLEVGKIIQAVLLVLGLLTVAGGVFAFVTNSQLGALSGIIFMLFPGVLAFFLGLWALRTLYKGGVELTQVPDVELPLQTPAPGDDFDDTLFRLARYRQGTVEFRERIQKRMTEAAIAVIRAREECSRQEAIRHLNEETWTDNQFAASFFTGGSPPRESLWDRWFGSDETSYERWVKVTVDAIAARAGLETESDPLIDEDESDGGFLGRLTSGSGSAGTVSPQANYRSEYEDAERVADGVLYKELHRTGTWRGIVAFVLVSAGWGVLTLTPSILLISAVGVGFAAYARLGGEPTLTDLEVERHVSDDQPRPGEPVQVTVTVKNAGDSFMPDLRLVDRLPGPMRVVEGSPRLATSLTSGSEATFTYVVVSERGTYEWPLVVIGRDVAGSVEREAAFEVDQTMQCTPTLETTRDMPVRSQTSLYSGEVNTDRGGSGLEFHSVRHYENGDPMRRINWRRLAKTGELATIDFRLERAAQVVLLFDTRNNSYVSPRPGERHAVDMGVEAAVEVFPALADRGDLVGVAAFDTVPCWLGPGAGDGHRERARRMFAGHPALSPIPPELSDEEGTYVDPMTHVRRQLSPSAQIMLFSPLTDEYTEEVARRLDSAGHLVTVLSPDPTTDRTVGQRLARVERAMRIKSLREHGIRVVDWSYDETLGLNLERAQQRWAV